MKRVLLVCYAFPPEPLPGALRPGYLARYLPRFGWQPTVLTPARDEPPFEADVVHAGTSRATRNGPSPVRTLVPKSGPLRAVLRSVKEALTFPDELAGWIPPAILTGLRVMRSQKYDAILTTALPTSAHVVGAALSKMTGTPWIADYRDLWSGNPYMPWGPVKSRLEKLMELCAIGQAAHITTVAEPLAQYLQSLHRRGVTVIENAFDPHEWEAIPDEPPTGFDLVYTGTLYGGKRDPDILFRALAQLRDAAHPLASAIRLHFYGSHNEAAREKARAFGFESQVTIHGIVPRIDALIAQRRSAALLIFLSMDPATAQERGSKYLEYLGAQRPMLVFGPTESVMRSSVEELKLGYFAADITEAQRALCSLFDAFSAGDYRAHARLENVQTAEGLAHRFARCLNAETGHYTEPLRADYCSSEG